MHGSQYVGAALDVSSPIGIPEHFTLVLAADGHHKPCHVVWRKEKRIGVAFDWQPVLASPCPDPNRPRTERIMIGPPTPVPNSRTEIYD